MRRRATSGRRSAQRPKLTWRWPDCNDFEAIWVFRSHTRVPISWFVDVASQTRVSASRSRAATAGSSLSSVLAAVRSMNATVTESSCEAVD